MALFRKYTVDPETPLLIAIKGCFFTPCEVSTGGDDEEGPGGGTTITVDGMEELCAKVEQLVNQQVMGSSALTSVGCVRDGEGKFAPITGIVFAKEDDDGNTIFVLVSSDGTITEPYEGTFDVKTGSTQWLKKDLWVDDPASNYCHYPIYMCVVGGVPDGQQYVCTGDEDKPFEELPVGITVTPYQPSGDGICAEAQVGPIELLPGATTVADIVAANIAGLVFDFNGTEVPVTADDISDVKITPKACETLNSAGEEVLVDFVNINDVAAEYFHDDASGGIDGTAAVEVPATGCAVVTLCFKDCKTKQEIAELG